MEERSKLVRRRISETPEDAVRQLDASNRRFGAAERLPKKLLSGA